MQKRLINFQLKNVNFSIADIDFVNINDGFAIDNEGRILKTENSGVDWISLYTSNYELLDIQFIDK